ncbi:ComEC/Rec2 family competence protein [Asticcacaulis sp. AND118]|uniref:ComEC/Rec2 family competence protein n=1 Tax=Asticcacaulis sp. AND118 TaxID=2840468 RepID=UPI001CFFA6C5|nr:ComEC/Rec2 family competence protein [Asticcacaulis sp. AND118]UDF02343.1 ComEC family competence protein [Asticcacaulis sp. AND118]
MTDAIAAQTGRLVLWLPVALGGGCAAYLSLRFEPSGLWVLGLIAAMGGLYALAQRFEWKLALRKCLLLALMVVLGVGLCKLRTQRVAAPVLSSEQTQFRLDAVVVDIVGTDTSEPKLLLAPLRLSGVAPEETPIRVRLSLRELPPDIAPGQAISTFAILHPPAGPNIPGGYDYARAAWFDAVGAVGFAPGRVRLIETPPLPVALQRMTALNHWRWEVTQRLTAQVNAPRMGGFAAALVTGHQAFLAPDLVEDMRDSGLAHILSISGLHMAIVGGFAFFACRAALALLPFVALHYPIKKWAAGFGIVAVGVYLALSGAPSPAIRAAVVAWVAFGAILFDRRALSLRALAVAAIIVLLLMPEAVLEPGFQMSFCATAALLALAEASRNPVRELDVPWWVRGWQNIWHWLKVSVLASTVAGLATTPFGIFYFGRAQMYGLISNLLEAPVTGFVVMPALAVGTVLSATPLSMPFLWLASQGLTVIAHIAAFVADLPGAVMTVGAPPNLALAVSMGGVLWMCLIRGNARWLGLIAALAVVYWPRETPPDIWLDAEGGNAAIQTKGSAYALRPTVRQYGYQLWLKRYALNEAGGRLAQDYVCKSYICVPTATAPYRIGFAFGRKSPKPEQLEALCLSSKLVVLRSQITDWPDGCAGVNRITASDFERLGAMELTRTEAGGWNVKAAEPLRGRRPWTQKRVKY